MDDRSWADAWATAGRLGDQIGMRQVVGPAWAAGHASSTLDRYGTLARGWKQMQDREAGVRWMRYLGQWAEGSMFRYR